MIIIRKPFIVISLLLSCFVGCENNAERDSGRGSEKRGVDYTPGSECVVAHKASCCDSPSVPMLRAVVEADACLLMPGEKVDQRCALDCKGLNCLQGQPAPLASSLLAELDQTGSCVFKSECETKNDCALAVQLIPGNKLRTAIARPRWFINAEPDWVLLEEVPIEELMAKDGTIRPQPYGDVDCVADQNGDNSAGKMPLNHCVSK